MKKIAFDSFQRFEYFGVRESAMVTVQNLTGAIGK